MSFAIRGGIIQNTVKVGAIASHMTTRMQGAMAQVARQGLDYLRNDADLPVDTAALQATAASGVNQFAVWFRVAIAPDNTKYGSGKPYGPAQNYGWHDRAGAFHEGHFFLEKTEIMAGTLLRAYVALAWSDARGIGGGAYNDVRDALGDASAVIGAANPDGVTAANLDNPYG